MTEGWSALTVDEGWLRLLAAARRSLERTGGSLDTAVTLSAPTDAERRVVIAVTGAYRSASATRLTVRLADVDAYLRAGHQVDLVTVAGPRRNRPAEAKYTALAREAVLSLAATSRHARSAWFEEWLAGLRRDGTLTRMVRGGIDIRPVVKVLDALPAADEPMPIFADRVLDDTKALADGGVRGLVVRALAAWTGVPVPAGSEQERQLWESVGVVLDDLASQVLVLNLPATDGGLVATWLESARPAGVPLRLTLHQLRLAPPDVRCPEVFVCENPAVLRAAAAMLGPRSRPLICTEGVPSAAVHTLLRCAPDATVRWRNDFDWTGVRLTAAALTRYPTAVPWRMAGECYRRASDTGPALVGAPAETPWDPDLAGFMRAAGRAVMEERLLAVLLNDLRHDA